MQLAIPQMSRQGGGMIVNVASGTATADIPGLAGYASSKATLGSLTRTAAKELAGEHILVSVFDPGPTATNLGKNAIRAGETDPRPVAAQTVVPQSPDEVAAKLIRLVREATLR